MNKKNLLSFVFCLLISIGLTYYINGKGGLMLCICLVFAFLLSTVNFIAVKDKVFFEIKYDNVNLRKGDTFGVALIVSKKCLLPTPYVEIKLHSTEKLTPLKSEIFKTSLFSKNEKLKIKAEYKAEYSGKSTIEIEYVKVTDFLGIFSKLIYKKTEKDVAELRVLPNIPDRVYSSDILKSVADAVTFDDNDEDTGETVRFGVGTPGYEHRAYVPGDPIKKINWKLSSKREQYLLRLDEKPSVSGQLVIVDVFSKNNDKQTFSDCDNLVEGCLGLLSSMIKQELECECYVCNKNGWNSFKVADEKSLSLLQTELSTYDLSLETQKRIPDGIEKEKGTAVAVVFTNNLDDSLVSAGNTPVLQSFYVTKENYVKTHPDNVWVIDDVYELSRLR